MDRLAPTLWGLLALLVLGGVGCKRGDQPEPRSTDEVGEPEVTVGRRMYREGIRPSGEPLTATVTEDVPFLGTQFSCESCHGRSGMGAAEGQYIVPGITGPLLYAPSVQPKRPAYDVQSLGRALREGVDPGGRALKPLMPRYQISDAELRSLAAYLKQLSPGPSPGVDDKSIRLATIVTDDVSPDARDDFLAVLRAFVDDKNRQTRGESERWDRGTTPESKLPTLFREWVLDVWTLTGPSDGWPKQLEERYRSAPVFAVLSGLTAGSWGPIGRFCERHEIPCLFPSTDLPDAEQGDFYTVHFSRGLELEADLIASRLFAQSAGSVVQVFCGATPARAAAFLRSTLVSKGVATLDLEFDCEGPLPVAELSSRMTGTPETAAVLWLEHRQLARLEGPLPRGPLYFSSSLLGRDLSGPLLSAPGPVFVAHPYKLPGAPDPGLLRFTAWARVRAIELGHPRLQGEAFFACLAANDGIIHMERYYVRDYVLDMLDHAQDLALYLPIHTRATFGPDQRFLTKGGYLIPIVDGQPDTKAASWISP